MESWLRWCESVRRFAFLRAGSKLSNSFRAVAANAKAMPSKNLRSITFFPDGAEVDRELPKESASAQPTSGQLLPARSRFRERLTSMDLKHKTDASITATTSGLYEDLRVQSRKPAAKSPLEELKANKLTNTTDDWQHLV